MVESKKKSKNKPSTTPKLHIGIIMQSPDIGGAEMYMLSLIDSFLADGHKVLVAANESKFLIRVNERVQDTYQIPVILDIIGNVKGLIRSTYRLPYAVYCYARLLQKMKKNNVNVLLMSGFSEKLLVTFLSIFFQISVVWIEYGKLETVFKRNFYLPKILYRSLKDIPKTVIIPSQHTMQSLIIDARVSLAKLRLIPCGIKIHKRIPNAKKKVFPEWQSNEIIGSVSRLTREKGQQYLILSIPDVIKKVPSARFLIIGDGPDREYFTRLAKQLKIEKYIKITGFVNDIAVYYSAMDIFVFPTVWDLEGFGLVTPEAMSYGIPVIASKLGPVPEIVHDEVTGILVPPADEHTLAQTIIKLLQDKKKRISYGRKGQEKAVSNYNIEHASRKLVDALQDAVIV